MAKKEFIKRVGLPGYETFLREDEIHVVFGGKNPVNVTKDEIVMAVNVSVFNDEYWYDLNHTRSPKTARTEIFSNGNISHNADGVKHGVGFTEDEFTEWGIIYDEVPINFVEEYQLKHSKGLYFLRQIDLTQEELDAGDYYEAENVKGSYVIMMDKSHNEYKAGRLGDIRPPRVKDAFNNYEYCTIEITPEGATRMLKVYLPETFMKNADYPVKLCQ
jgi:hypothetical protein